MSPKAAAAYLLADRILVHSECRTRRGMWIASDPFVSVAMPADLTVLGRAVADALGNSKPEVPDPENWSRVTEDLVNAAGLGSYRQLQLRAALCRIERAQDGTSIVPHHNGGTSGDGKGFHSLPARSVLLPAGASGTELARALLGGFDRCTSTVA